MQRMRGGGVRGIPQNTDGWVTKNLQNVGKDVITSKCQISLFLIKKFMHYLMMTYPLLVVSVGAEVVVSILVSASVEPGFEANVGAI